MFGGEAQSWFQDEFNFSKSCQRMVGLFQNKAQLLLQSKMEYRQKIYIDDRFLGYEIHLSESAKQTMRIFIQFRICTNLVRKKVIFLRHYVIKINLFPGYNLRGNKGSYTID